MDFINHTPVPADVAIGQLPGQPDRAGLITAKATFRLQGGAAVLDTQAPLPVLRADEPTELGIVPADVVFHTDPHLQVMVLGRAHAPGGAAIEAMDVALTVGDTRRSLRVTGDRRWLPESRDGGPGTGVAAPSIGSPEPFFQMPLTWARAYGGRREVEIDRESFIDVAHPANPHGRGFDAAAHAKTYAEALAVPDGYPRFDETRWLPNVEDPAACIEGPGDDPLPCCWAPLPLDVPLRAMRAARQLEGPAAGEPAGATTAQKLAERYERAIGGSSGAVLAALLRAHPDWTVPVPRAKARVTMEGLTSGGLVSFELPQLRVVADYVVGERTGARELVPQVLLLLPEEGRLCLVYRSRFRVAYGPTLERAFRLRLEPGWVEEPS